MTQKGLPMPVSKPIRVQRKRTKGWRMPLNTVYVGRPSKWGNPYVVYGYPEIAVELYKEILEIYMADIEELRGKNLCCWCPLDKACHADILLKIANEEVYASK